MAHQALEHQTLRLNPSYEIIAFTSLSPKERRVLGRLKESGQYAALLRPRNGTTLALKAINADTYRLLQHFVVPAVPSSLPREYVAAGLSHFLRQQVAESVLQVKNGP